MSTCCKKRKYGFGTFLWDVLMTACTGGLWLIYIFCREMRNR
jgi:hypothetical protein